MSANHRKPLFSRPTPLLLMVGTTIGKMKESFTDLDFANDVVLLADMLSVLVSALEVMDREAHPLGMISLLTGPRPNFRISERWTG